MAPTVFNYKMLSILIFFMAVLIGNSPVRSEPLNNVQKKEVKKIISEYLMENPNVILNALEKLRKQEQVQQKTKNNKLISKVEKNFIRKFSSPIYGNPRGNVEIVEFFDYRCGYCKQAFRTIERLLKEDKNIRFSFVELPILSRESELAARAALTIWKNQKEKYFDFHSALMKNRLPLSFEQILIIAQQIGINKNVIVSNIRSQGITDLLQQNHKLAARLKIRGTPAFIIGDQLIPGAISLDRIKHIVAEVRSKG